MLRRLIFIFIVCCAATCSTAGAEVYDWGSYIGGKSAAKHETPVEVAGTSEAVAISAGNSSDYALTASGAVLAWGNNEHGQLGNGTKAANLNTAVTVTLPGPASAVGEDKNGAAAIIGGHLWVWGEDGDDSLCLAGSDITTPVEVGGVSEAVEVHGGQNHLVIRLANGSLLGCGTNAEGQLGLGSKIKKVKKPTAIPGLSNIIEISTGNRTTAALNASGELSMMGQNIDGQVCVGESSANDVVTATHVSLPETVHEVSAGGDLTPNGSTLILTEAKVLYACGDDEHGQLGDEGSTNERSPVRTSLSFASVAAGGAESLGLTESSDVESWGSGVGGDLGDGVKGSALTPGFVLGDVSAISATAESAVALR